MGISRPSCLIWGLSPHARGNRCRRPAPGRAGGPIPACAGEPTRSPARALASRAYPRMRGGTVKAQADRIGLEGLSPHARGNRLEVRIAHLLDGPIPACAGEPCSDRSSQKPCGAYPRMRGGTAKNPLNRLAARGLSPHARGNHIPADLVAFDAGPIPACAGEPHPSRSCRFRCGAYPRMRGGTPMVDEARKAGLGLSPHARGNLTWKSPITSAAGPIPACAGEPLDHKHLIQKEISLFQFDF